MLRSIGHGPGSEVFLARTPWTNPPLAALKVFAVPVRRSEEAWDRAVAEAKLARGFNHPNIVSVLDVGRVEGQLYVAAERVEGRSLAELADRGREEKDKTPVLDVVCIVADLLAGLAYLHGKNLLHRRVTATNAFADYRGTAKLGDFGLLHALPAQLGEVTERSAELAPELAGGHPPDAASDLYGIGALMYRLLTARALRRSQSAESLRALERERPELPTRIAAWLSRMLHADPKRRPLDARSALERLLETAGELGLALDHPSVGQRLTALFGTSTGADELSARDVDVLTDRLEIGVRELVFDEDSVTDRRPIPILAPLFGPPTEPAKPGGGKSIATDLVIVGEDLARDPKVPTLVISDAEDELPMPITTGVGSDTLTPADPTGFGRGTLFGPYELLGRIADGGMAVVHRARERSTNRLCALKLISKANRGNVEFREMLEEEGRISRMLEHPNLVRCYDAGVIDDTPYIAFELIEGTPLDAWIATHAPKPLPISVALEIGIELAKGLEYAHRLTGRDGRPLELVHRDVSPQNILISRTGEVKLLDFGISRFREREHETRTGLVKGKLIYMAPEQVNGASVDRRADLFQLGLVIAEIVAGKRLTPPKPYWIAAHVPDLGPVLKGYLAPRTSAVPEALVELLTRMTASSPAKRPPSAALVLRELRAIWEPLEPRISLEDLTHTT